MKPLPVATLALAALVALLGSALMLHPAAGLSAQSLVAPTFTAAQQAAGDAIYKESCASCHGRNLDDGEFGPPLKGVEFRSAWFGRTADVLFEKIEAMPPAAPGSLGAEKHAALLAYLMSQNLLAAADKPVPADVDQLKAMLLPGFTGGPSGGLSANVALPPAPHIANPLDRYTPITDAMRRPASGRPGGAQTTA
jgi:mono/diheme cytochrome c family protein